MYSYYIKKGDNYEKVHYGAILRGGGGQLDSKSRSTQGVPEAQHYNASLYETRRHSQAIISHAELVSASNHSQAEERLCHRAFIARSKKEIADNFYEISAMTGVGQESGSNRVEQLNDKSLSSYRPSFLPSKTSPILTSPGGRNTAFTLAEVLITLGIISVVAALTLPTLIQNYQEKATVTKLKKIYSILSQAYLSVQEKYGPINEWLSQDTNTGEIDEEGNKILNYSDQELLISRLKEFIRTSSDNTDFKHTNITIDGRKNNLQTIPSNRYIILSDGSVINSGWVNSAGTQDAYIDIGVYLYNKNDEYTLGKNVFYFVINRYGVIADGQAKRTPGTTMFPYLCKITDNSTTNNGRACTAWVIQNENMDYLHCSDLSWSGKTKCK